MKITNEGEDGHVINDYNEKIFQMGEADDRILALEIYEANQEESERLLRVQRERSRAGKPTYAWSPRKMGRHPASGPRAKGRGQKRSEKCP